MPARLPVCPNCRWIADNVPVPSFSPRMRCTACGHLGADARPNWSDRADIMPGGARYSPPGPYEDVKKRKGTPPPEKDHDAKAKR